MKILGIIVEYNPFHTGHLYHLQKAKEMALEWVKMADDGDHYKLAFVIMFNEEKSQLLINLKEVNLLLNTVLI